MGEQLNQYNMTKLTIVLIPIGFLLGMYFFVIRPGLQKAERKATYKKALKRYSDIRHEYDIRIEGPVKYNMACCNGGDGCKQFMLFMDSLENEKNMALRHLDSVAANVEL